MGTTIKILLVIFISQTTSAFSQAEHRSVRAKKMKAHVVLISEKKFKGLLRSISDSTIKVFEVNSETTAEFHYRDISKIQINKGRAKLKGGLIGAGFGILINALVLSSGLGSDDEIPVGPVLIIFSIPIVSAVIGSNLSKQNATSKVEGSLENFLMFKRKMLAKGFTN